jgi:hypothetical protein
VLTDGIAWRFFYLDSEYNLYLSKIVSDCNQKALEVLGTIQTHFVSNCLGLLTLLSTGAKPGLHKDNSSALWLESFDD